MLQEQGDRRCLHWSHVREPERVHYLQRHWGQRRLDRAERQRHGQKKGLGGGRCENARSSNNLVPTKRSPEAILSCHDGEGRTTTLEPDGRFMTLPTISCLKGFTNRHNYALFFSQ
jgi:hypothetical protein